MGPTLWRSFYCRINRKRIVSPSTLFVRCKYEYEFFFKSVFNFFVYFFDKFIDPIAKIIFEENIGFYYHLLHVIVQPVRLFYIAIRGWAFLCLLISLPKCIKIFLLKDNLCHLHKSSIRLDTIIAMTVLFCFQFTLKKSCFFFSFY